MEWCVCNRVPQGASARSGSVMMEPPRRSADPVLHGEDPQVMDIDVQIEGVSDPKIADAIRKRIRRVIQTIPLPGDRRITVLPSGTRRECDVGEQAPRW